jgi:3-hydroxyisobutyrate dehydrogenase-like beta-hydroxyacid dehydrogenase
VSEPEIARQAGPGRRAGDAPAGTVAVVAVLGLGEAGSAIARDLVASGVAVRGFDPLAGAPDGVIETGSDSQACEGADLVLSLTTAHEAEAAMRATAPGLAPGTLYADLNTSSAGLKLRLAAIAEQQGVVFADVAIMSPVPGRGIRTPMVVSGPAASRKLVRSVFYKGMAAAVVESLRAGRAAGCEDWLRENIAEDLGAAMIDRLEQGSITHAVRRADEMAAASELLAELGVPARIASASRDWLAQLAKEAAANPGE